MIGNHERRSLARFPLQLTVRIQLPETGASAFAETRDVSAGGIYLYTNLNMEIGSDIEFVLSLPQELTAAAVAINVECKGKILRVDNELSGGRTGIAAEIYSYDFLSQAAAF
jgi:c-di-GMP-binding flagellar brake protein YcgR